MSYVCCLRADRLAAHGCGAIAVSKRHEENRLIYVMETAPTLRGTPDEENVSFKTFEFSRQNGGGDGDLTLFECYVTDEWTDVSVDGKR